jgi:transposase
VRWIIEVKTMADVQKMVELYNLYGSYTRVARELHSSRNTVKKYIRQVNEVREGTRVEILPKNRYINQPPRIVTKEILNLIYSLLEQNLTRPRKQRLNALQIFDHVTQAGYSVSYTTVKRIIASWKKTRSAREVYILQEPEPGYRAEFDWCDVSLQIHGVWMKLSMAVMVLTYSLYRFSRLYCHETQQEVLDAHIQFFKEIQGVPRYIFYDNLKAVYDYSRKQFQDTYVQFAIHHGYSYEVCNPVSPHEKGTDEESVSFVRRNAFGERTSFDSIEEAQEWLVYSLEQMNSHPVYRRNQTPVEALKEEQNSMIPLPSLEYSNILTRTACISKYSFVTLDRNYYSVPDTYRKKEILLKISQDQIDLISGPDLIASHRRLYGKGQYSLNISHFLKTFERKPGAIRHSKVIQQAPQPIQDLYEKYFRESPLEFIKILSLSSDFSLQTLVSTIEYLQKSHIQPGYDTIRMVLSNTPQPDSESLEKFDRVNVQEPDLTVYDQLMGCKA